MGRVRRLVATGLPDVEVTEYDAEERGMPNGHFSWALYDVLVITYELGETDAGYLWLRDLITMPGILELLPSGHRGISVQIHH